MTLPPGRLRLATRPSLTGSSPEMKTIGIVARRRLGREPGDDAPGRGDNGYLTANHFQPFEIMLIAQ